MKDELDPKKVSKLKQALSNLKSFRVSDPGRETFVSKLEKIPERKPKKGLSFIKERLYYVSLDVVEKISNSFARPVPAFARVAVLCLILITVYSAYFMPQIPRAHDIKGTVKIFNAGKNEWIFAKNNQKLGRGDILKTFGDGRVDLSLGKLYSMRLGKDSEIKVTQLSSRMTRRGLKFHINKGKVLAYYAGYEQGRGRSFELETGEVIAEALGTNFMVESIPDFKRTWVGVLDGRVKVTSREIRGIKSPEEATVYVESGNKTLVKKGRVPERPRRMMEDRWLELGELYSIGKNTQVALLISAGGSRTRELLQIAPLYISEKKPSVLPDKLKKAIETFNQAVERGLREKHIESIRHFEDILKEYPNPQYDVQLLLFIGSYYERLRKHEKAISTFQKVIDEYSRSRLASIAQCAIGIIYEEKIRDKEKAEKAYRKIIKLYPESPEVREAVLGLKRLSR